MQVVAFPAQFNPADSTVTGLVVCLIAGKMQAILLKRVSARPVNHPFTEYRDASKEELLGGHCDGFPSPEKALLEAFRLKLNFSANAARLVPLGCLPYKGDKLNYIFQFEAGVHEIGAMRTNPETHEGLRLVTAEESNMALPDWKPS